MAVGRCGHCPVLPGYKTSHEIFSGTSSVCLGAFRLGNRKYASHQIYCIISSVVLYWYQEVEESEKWQSVSSLCWTLLSSTLS